MILQASRFFGCDALFVTQIVWAWTEVGHARERRIPIMMNLSGKVALITGGNGGIGLAMAAALAAPHPLHRA